MINENNVVRKTASDAKVELPSYSSAKITVFAAEGIATSNTEIIIIISGILNGNKIKYKLKGNMISLVIVRKNNILSLITLLKFTLAKEAPIISIDNGKVILDKLFNAPIIAFGGL